MRIVTFSEQFYTSLPPSELLQRLQANLIPPFTWRTLFSVDEAPFKGKIIGNSFVLRRNTKFGRQSGPKTLGLIEAVESSRISLVRLRYQPSSGTLLFAGCWLGIIGLFSGSFVTAKLLLYGFTLALLVPAGIWLSGILLFAVRYWWEIKKVRQLLILLLDPHEQAAP